MISDGALILEAGVTAVVALDNRMALVFASLDSSCRSGFGLWHQCSLGPETGVVLGPLM